MVVATALLPEVPRQARWPRRQEDRLFVQFDLHNKTNSFLSVEWALEWRDDQGFKIDSLENWRPLKLGGRGFETITAIAPILPP